jgi:hypothetical protein
MLGRVRKASDESAFMNEAMKEERAVDKVDSEVVYVPDPEAEARALEAEGKLQEALAEMASVKEKLEARPETVMPDFEPKPDEPPSSIADLFQADKPLAPQARALRELWLQIGHQIQRGEAKADEIRKHERLSSELEFINRHAFDGV